MSILNVKDLNKEFNSIVINYMNNGYIIAPIIENARCSNTFLHVSLAKPDEDNKVICVWIHSKGEKIKSRWIKKAIFLVREYEIPDAVKIGYEKFLFHDEGTLLFQKEFYALGNNMYTDNRDELYKKILHTNKQNKNIAA